MQEVIGYSKTRKRSWDITWLSFEFPPAQPSDVERLSSGIGLRDDCLGIRVQDLLGGLGFGGRIEIEFLLLHKTYMGVEGI